MMPRFSLIVPLIFAGVFLAMPSRADEPVPAPSQDAESPPPADPIAEDVRAHHRRGLELYDEGDLRLALVEFERAYAIGKSYKVLFNIGQVHFQLNNYAKARRALEQYLALGGDAIDAKRRTDVEKDVATLKTRTATLTIRVNVEGAEVAINDTSVGKAPLDGALVDAGVLRVQITRSGYTTRVHEVTLAGGDMQTLTVEMTAVPSSDVVVATSGLPGTAIASWIVTGVLAAGAAGTGIAANAAASAYEAKRTTPIAGSPEQARADLERQRDLVSALAITTDILLVSTLVAGGVSLYLTLRDRPKPEAPRVRVRGAGAMFTVGF